MKIVFFITEEKGLAMGVFSNIWALLQRFRRNQRGDIAIMLGLMAIPLLLAAGIALDYANYTRIRHQVQSAVDGAALAAARSMGTQAERKALAEKYFSENMGSLMTGYGVQLAVDDQTNKITVTASLDSPNYLMKLVNLNTTPMSVTATALRQVGKLEIALIFDTTGSMEGSRITNLKKAAKDFVDILFAKDSISPTVSIGLVPFSAAVNVGDDKGLSFGIDVNGLSTVSNYNFIDPSFVNWHNWKAWSTITNKSWTGCVEARAGSLAFDDTPPSSSNPQTLFTPYFAPDEPGNAIANDISSIWMGWPIGYLYYYNSWRNDGVTTLNLDTRQRNVAKYTNSPISGSYANNQRGPDHNCPTEPILPLTNVKSTIYSALNQLTARGSTVIVEGVMWGYRVLSPGAPYTEGSPFKTNGQQKIAVILTDGENDIGATQAPIVANHNGSFYSAFGFASQGRLGVTTASAMTNILNTKTREVCTLLKNQGVTVYTFTYEVTDPDAITLLRDCASEPAKSLEITESTIQQQFSDLANQIRSLYLSY